ncbi:MAG: hypothetical protein WCF82_04615 [Microcoleus sp.]
MTLSGHDEGYGGIHSGRSLDLVEFEMERAIVSLDRAIACDSIVAI